MKKIGIYGGSFNPIHVGHLTAAEEAKKQLGLDRVIFVPAGNPYFKDQSELADFGARAAMVRDAIAGVPYFEVSEIEGNPRKPSYTSETLTFFHDHRKGAKHRAYLPSRLFCRDPRGSGVIAFQNVNAPNTKAELQCSAFVLL